MKKLISILLILMSISAFGQRWKLQRMQMNFGVGATNYFGDIGGTMSEDNLYGLKDLDLVAARPFMNLGMGYKFFQPLDVRVNLTYGYLAGKDMNSKLEGRELSFYTSMFEPSLQVSYSIITFGQKKRGSGRLFSRRGMMNNFSKMDIYLFGGAGYLFYKPTVNSTEALNDRIVIHGNTEFNMASGGSLIFPAGIGLYYVLNKEWDLGLEIGGRYTFTDFLDGFSSVYSKTNDLYYITSFKLKYKIRTNYRGMPIIEFLRKY